MTTTITNRILSVRDLAVTFPSEQGPVEAVRGIDLDLIAGRTLALVGESGSGKSTVATSIMGLLPPGARTQGEVVLDGRNLLDLNDRQMSAVRGRRIGMVFQDPLSALTPIFSVGRQVADAVQVHNKVSKRAAWERAVELLDLVGIPQPHLRARDFPHQFSGGMRQRVIIALAIANDPDVIIADEPTTALDVTVQAQILEVLEVAKSETGAGVLLITHDLGVVAGHADDVAVMYAGRIVERAPVEVLFATPAMPYTLGLLGSMPSPEATRRPSLVPIEGEPPSPAQRPTGCPFAPRCPLVRDDCRDKEPILAESGPRHDVACLRAADVVGRQPEEVFPRVEEPSIAPASAGEPILRLTGLARTFPVTKGAILRRQVGTLRAVSDVSFEIRAGETFCLVGESGSGKTTTLLEILRLRSPEAGIVEILGNDVASALPAQQRRELRQAVQIVMQDPQGALDPRLPVFELLAEPLRAAGYTAQATRDRMVELLDLVGLPRSSLDRFPAAFSGGQRQRLTIARALATKPRLLVLDEPVSALDVSVQASVLNLLMRLKSELGLAYLVVAHDLAVVRHVADRIAVMYLGHIVEIGNADDLFAEPRHPYTQALISAIPIPDPVRERSRERIVLSGEQPSAANPPAGCVFADRCQLRPTLDIETQELCGSRMPALEPSSSGVRVACHAA
ncbi:ABC transporter ATP-binding protein [Micromonospora sp. WMMD710]|uniref:dipeptide ABC transporter ATP-binding protein n=1 Tax=Micromonospora sp. WMMD710 TaxID=3016085 RepID=UPI002417F94F|nr:ABC transporter ATP-binding protein [Micromonospora sp. WMMD710]MDG4760267.1 ABC transporter ATP-binding protein [Micromonospora sp. WMMD710]